jgi:hypothetical protein
MSDADHGLSITAEEFVECCEGCRTGTADCDVNPIRTLDPYAEKRAQARAFLGDRALIAKPLGRLVTPRR